MGAKFGWTTTTTHTHTAKEKWYIICLLMLCWLKFFATLMTLSLRKPIQWFATCVRYANKCASSALDCVNKDRRMARRAKSASTLISDLTICCKWCLCQYFHCVLFCARRARVLLSHTATSHSPLTKRFRRDAQRALFFFFSFNLVSFIIVSLF